MSLEWVTRHYLAGLEEVDSLSSNSCAILGLSSSLVFGLLLDDMVYCYTW